MEVTEAGGRHQSSGARTRNELTIEVWVSLGRAAVGEHELHEIQRAIAKRFGAGAVDSPAAIARLLADEGAELRHPEIIEFDARWRQKRIEKGVADFAVFDRVEAAKPLRLKQAEALIKKLEKLRKKFERAGDAQALRSLRDEAVNARQTVQSLEKGERLSERVRGEQVEITEWLAVWIRTPTLFAEWLELRKRSTDFQQRFP
jgi:Ni/Co efflux regulator RcnB